MKRREKIDKGISIYLPENTKNWHIQINVRGWKRIRRSLNTHDIETARAQARHESDRLHTQSTGVVIPRDVPYERMIEAYREHAEARNEPGSRKLNYENLARVAAWIRKRTGVERPLRFSDFNPETLEAYMFARRKEGIAPETINRERGTLSSFFTRAKKRHLIRFNPAQQVDPLPTTKKRIPQILEPEEIDRLLEAAGRPVPFHGRGGKGQGNGRERLIPLHDFILFVLNTGARLGEALYFEWADVDLKGGLIRLLDKDEHRIKGRLERTVRANAVLLKMLRRRHLAAGGGRWVFPSSGGEVLDRKNLLRELKRVARTAKVKKVNFLILRHTALTSAARTCDQPFVLREMAGHTSIRTTERYYIGRFGAVAWTPPVLGS
jgi:integrase